MLYQLVVPNGKPDITFGMMYGNVTFKHGQLLPESDIVKLYPQFFIKVPESTDEKSDNLIFTQPVTIEKNENVVEKKKPGRPKNSFKGK